jgi:hypothetical protein
LDSMARNSSGRVEHSRRGYDSTGLSSVLQHCSPSNRYAQLLNPSKGEMLLHSLLNYQLHRKVSRNAALVIWSV